MGVDKALIYLTSLKVGVVVFLYRRGYFNKFFKILKKLTSFLLINYL